MGGYKVMNISMPEALFKKIDKVAKEENKTRSEFIREALRQYLEECDFSKSLKRLRKKAQEMGITTEEDVEKLIHDFRKQDQS